MAQSTPQQAATPAPHAQWPGTSAEIPGDAVAEILAIPCSELSLQGCQVIDRTSKYFDMVPETHAHILVHAMLLWNACLRAGIFIKPDVLSFVLLPVACFQIAAKLCGGHSCIEPTPRFLADVALSIAELMFDAPPAQSRHRTKDAVLATEVLVLQTLQFDVLMHDAVAFALELTVTIAG